MVKRVRASVIVDASAKGEAKMMVAKQLKKVEKE